MAEIVHEMEARRLSGGSGPLRLLNGGAVYKKSPEPDSLWGKGAECLWSRGEPLLLYASTGVGKTTLAESLALSSIGVGPSEILGFPVQLIKGRVLYIAADRPDQAMRSLRRMIKSEHKSVIDELWRWEVERQIFITESSWRQEADQVLDVAKFEEVELVVLDSLKDVSPDLSDERAGLAYNSFCQTLVANGVQICTLHHPRKQRLGGNGRMRLEDVYGSTWITAGQGSVVVMDGVAGSGRMKIRQLKSPSGEVGPLEVDLDYETGEFRSFSSGDLLDLIERVGPMTVRQVAETTFNTDSPSKREIQKVRRDLTKAVRDDELREVQHGGAKRYELVRSEPKQSTG